VRRPRGLIPARDRLRRPLGVYLSESELRDAPGPASDVRFGLTFLLKDSMPIGTPKSDMKGTGDSGMTTKRKVGAPAAPGGKASNGNGTLIVGYGRASSDDQSTGVQEQQLREAGCSIVLTENGSGTKLEGREKLALALSMLRAHPGSTLVVCRLDRLARSLKDALDILDQIDKSGGFLRVLDMGIDTRTPHGRMIGHVLLALAQWETEIRRERQALGIAKAKQERPKKYAGRKPSLDRARVAELLRAGKNKAEIARELGIARSSVYRLIDEVQ
jgi:DNA invertase Pin-like site-specific DNA recombinase